MYREFIGDGDRNITHNLSKKYTIKKGEKFKDYDNNMLKFSKIEMIYNDNKGA